MPRFSHPHALWLVALLPWFWWYARIAARRATVRTVWWRLTVAALLVLAAAGPQVPLRDGDMSVIYALDRSDSMPVRAQAAALTAINQWSATMRPADRAGVVVFGESAILERTLTPRLRLTDVSSTVRSAGTDLAAAIAAARAALPPRGSQRIVLFSDGCETTGDASEEAALAAAKMTAIDVVRPDGVSAVLKAVQITAPDSVRVGEPFPVTVVFEGPADGRGEVIVRRDGQPYVAQEVVVGADGTGSATFTDARDRSGLYTYRVSIRDETDPGETRGSDPGVVVAVTGAARVLIVTAAGRSLEPVLSTAGVDVTTTSPAALPAIAQALGGFDAIVLDDIPPEDLSTAQATAVARYVDEAGGGLLLLGGARSLDAAGYPTGPIGPLLPVDLRPRAGRRAPAMALVFVFDKSGSMADVADGVPKIELARSAAMKLLEVVPSSDSIGIIAFDASPSVVAPLGPQDAETVRTKLHALSASGPTAMSPAIDLAVRWLRGDATSASKRHVLLLSDGRTPPDEMSRVRDAVRGKDIQLSVVAIGQDADRAGLERLAESTGGRAYFPSDLRDLPRIVAREAARSAAGTMVQEPFTVRADTHPALAEIDRRTLPRLGGYIVGAAKPGAETLLSSHLDDPLLAAWRVGLGKVAVYTADLASPWSAGLRSWKDNTRLWRQTVSWLLRRLDEGGMRARLAEEGDDTRLRVEIHEPDGRFVSGLEVSATVRPPAGPNVELLLDATAPGEYAASLPMHGSGAYAVSIVARGRTADAQDRQVLRGFYRSAEREQRPCSAKSATLTRIAEMTGGRLRRAAESPFVETRAPEYHDISPWVTLAALLVFFFELTGPALGRLRPLARWRPSRPSGLERGRAA